MTEEQAKEQIISLAKQIDRIDGLVKHVDDDIAQLVEMRNSLTTLYIDAADQIERLASDIHTEKLVSSVMKVTGAMRYRKEQLKTS